MTAKKAVSCIAPDKVPCDKARSYLQKKGLLCGSNEHPGKKIKPDKSWFEKWFG